MRRIKLLLVLMVLIQAGCTAQSLRRQTIAQTGTWTDIHYRQVMENLAMVANNPDVLPCYSVLDFGTTDVSDTVGFAGLALAIAGKSAANTGTVDPQVKRTIKDNWTLAQVTGPEKLRALHLAFKYAVYNDASLLTVHDHRVTLGTFCYPPGTPSMPGQQATNASCIGTPPRPSDPCNDSGYPGEPGFYFHVANELRLIPAGWLHVGTKKQVPHCACFKACSCNTWVWVMPEDMAALSQFTLVVQRIARQVTEQAYFPPPDTLTIAQANVPSSPTCAAPPKPPAQDSSAVELVAPGTASTDQQITPMANAPQVLQSCTSLANGGSAPMLVGTIALPVDCYGNVVVLKIRGDAISTSDGELKSAVSASIKSP